MWMYFFGGMVVAVGVISLGVGLWYIGGKKTLAVQSWGHMILGVAAMVVALYLGFQLFTVGGFLAWCWKLPVVVIAGMVMVVAVDIGLHGDHPR